MPKSELTRERVETIRKGCDGVTPGPWQNAGAVTDGLTMTSRSHIVDFGKPPSAPFMELLCGIARSETWEQNVKNAAHIARLDPATVRQLCDSFLEAERLREALNHIAAWNDTLASNHLAETGSYSAFDEPDSVEIARAALSKE